MKSRWDYFLIILVFLITACNLPSSTKIATPILPTLPFTPTPKEVTPTIKVLPTFTNPGTITTVPSQISLEPRCVLGKSTQTLETTSFEKYPEAIQAFINSGATPEDLDKVLYEAGIENQPIGVASADLTGNGKMDFVVSIFNPSSENIPPSGKILIYVCENGRYLLGYEEESEKNWGAPGIRYLQDLNDDGGADLVESSPSCGASTCFEDVKVQEWNGSRFENRFEGSSTDLPFPDIRINGPGNDGFYQIEIVASGFGSVGAGPQRNISRIWSYHPDDELWIPGEDILGKSNFRIHILFDAESALNQGDYTEALQLYGRVIHDTTLDDWIDPAEERSNLTAYSLFKSAIVYILQGQSDFAQTTFKQLAAEFPDDTSQHAYTLMEDAFLNAYNDNNYSTACLAAREFAAIHEEQILTPLGSQSFGYANPDYKSNDVCPLP